MKSYSSFKGAQKAAGPHDVILRLLNDPQELFVVVPAPSQIMIYNTTTDSSGLTLPLASTSIPALTEKKD